MATKNDDKFIEITGHLYKLYPVVTFDSGFAKREFVIEKHSEGRDGKTYKDLIKFEATKSWIGEMDNIGIGSEIKVYFTLGGKEWTPPNEKEPKFINFMRCWKVDVLENTNQDLPATVQKEEYADVDLSDNSDDLPF